MHLTLHLTNTCNMACSYCYVHKNNPCHMTAEIMRKAVDMAAVPEASTGIIFFGGEPLLRKELIYEAIDYTRWKASASGALFHYKITTNGILMDDDFIDYSLRNNLFITLSHDGIKSAHDSFRVSADGSGTFHSLSSRIDSLLDRRPYAPVLMTVRPETVCDYFESVSYLYKRGFRYIICSLDYSADWKENHIAVLKGQYQALSDFYYEKTMNEEKFYLSPFEVKLSSHINNATYCRERCELGKKQLSVGPDGFIYPCVQFVGEKEFSIGHVSAGLDEEKRYRLYAQNEEEKQSCLECAVRSRCNHHCGCMNKQATGSIEQVSPVLCAHERLLIPIADKLAEKLFKKRNGLFIQKHYNDLFPLLSLIEDKRK